MWIKNYKNRLCPCVLQLSPVKPFYFSTDAKRIIGRTFDDAAVTRWVNSKEILFSLVPGESNMAAFEVTVNGKKEIITPEEVSAEILKYLKRMAEEFLADTITEAVISVPARFNIGQRKATRKAAELAGFKSIRLLTEPVAGAVHYIKDRGVNLKIMAFDWGGGTLDISFLKANNNKFEVEFINGNTLCGGRDIDDNLMKYFDKDAKNVKFPNKFRRRLLEQCIEIKKELSIEEEATRTIDSYNADDDDLELNINRETFEKINANVLQCAINIIERGLKTSQLKVTDIDQVVLIGGSSRICKIQEYLKNTFGANKIKTDLNPCEAVAAGACLYAYQFTQEPEVLIRKYEIIEATPYSLGIETFGGLMEVIVPKNSPIPFSNCKTLQLAKNGQRVVPFNIYEGERADVNLNNLIGSFSLTGLPPKAAGELNLTVTFKLDDNGILNVNATESSSAIDSELTVAMSELQLNEHRVTANLEDIEKMKTDDENFREFVIRKRPLHIVCENIKNNLKTLDSDSNRQKVEKMCSEFQEILAQLTVDENDKLPKIFENFKKKIIPLLRGSRQLRNILNSTG